MSVKVRRADRCSEPRSPWWLRRRRLSRLYKVTSLLIPVMTCDRLLDGGNGKVWAVKHLAGMCPRFVALATPCLFLIAKSGDWRNRQMHVGVILVRTG